MANKEVGIEAPYLPVTKGNYFDVHVQDDGRFGSLRIYKGKIEWYAKHAKNPTAEISWHEFDALMKKHAEDDQ